MSNLILIGMPGAGKSTLGVQLAKMRGMDFADTDVLIQVSENTLLHKILEDSDFRNLRRLEEGVLLGLDLAGHVIATGESAVHSEAEIYTERSPLYRKYADMVIDCTGQSQSDLLEQLASIPLNGEN